MFHQTRINQVNLNLVSNIQLRPSTNSTNLATMPDNPTSDDNISSTHISLSLRPHAVMPHPGQLDSLEFDGNNISDFLEDWNIECEDYGLTDTQKCARFPNYCTPTIKDLVKLLPGYTTPNWTLLQANFKETYCQHDKPED